MHYKPDNTKYEPNSAGELEDHPKTQDRTNQQSQPPATFRRPTRFAWNIVRTPGTFAPRPPPALLTVNDKSPQQDKGLGP